VTLRRLTTNLPHFVASLCRFILSPSRVIARIFPTPPKGATHGVPALAGQTRFRPGSHNVLSRFQGATPCRLKPGLHAPQTHARCIVSLILCSIFPCTSALAAGEEIPPLKPPRPELSPSSQHGWIAAVAVVVALGVIAFWIAWRRRAKPVTLTPPEVLARSALEALRGKTDNEMLVADVSRILRHYVIAAFSLPPDELTTTELQKALQLQSQAPPELSAAIIDFLRRCDEWKFAPVSNPARLDPVACALELLEKTEAHRKQPASAVQPKS